MTLDVFHYTWWVPQWVFKSQIHGVSMLTESAVKFALEIRWLHWISKHKVDHRMRNTAWSHEKKIPKNYFGELAQYSETSPELTTTTKRNRTINTLRPKQNCRHLADNISKCIFLNENIWILLQISLKFVPKVQVPALVQIMAWCWPGTQPLSGPMMDSFLMRICTFGLNELTWKHDKQHQSNRSSNYVANPKNKSNGSSFTKACCSLILVQFTHILQDTLGKSWITEAFLNNMGG